MSCSHLFQASLSHLYNENNVVSLLYSRTNARPVDGLGVKPSRRPVLKPPAQFVTARGPIALPHSSMYSLPCPTHLRSFCKHNSKGLAQMYLRDMEDVPHSRTHLPSCIWCQLTENCSTQQGRGLCRLRKSPEGTDAPLLGRLSVKSIGSHSFWL